MDDRCRTCAFRKAYHPYGEKELLSYCCVNQNSDRCGEEWRREVNGCDKWVDRKEYKK
jgi:hypothetical protein